MELRLFYYLRHLHYFHQLCHFSLYIHYTLTIHGGIIVNYQYLHYKFFTPCRKRKINKTPMLLLIYLRGLYSRFGNIFTWKDKTIINDLGINRKMLQRSRLALQEKGVIDFVSGKGQEPTQYLILDSVLE